MHNHLLGTLLCLNCLLCACGRQPSAVIQPAQTSRDSFVVAGDYELHYNAVRSDHLTPEVARTHHIERSKNKVLLNVLVLRRNPGVAGNALDAELRVVVRNLHGQLKHAPLRRIATGSTISYLAEVSFSGAETLVFEITATPSGSVQPISASFSREFFAD